jgi:histidinol-phosphate aminotransferase
VARELGLSRIVKLASNESPFPPLPAVLEAIANRARDLHRYPDDESYELSLALASFHGVEPSNVLTGAGSADIITYAWRVMAGPGDHGIYPWPSFVVYPIAGTYAGSVNIPVPLTDSHAHDLDAMLEAASAPEARVVVLCNPNNPTGTYIGHDDLLAFIDEIPEHVLVINDEAYHELADAPDYPRLLLDVLERPNVITTRTFSKIYSLAGLRVGYTLGPAPLLTELRKGRLAFAVSAVAQDAAIEALRHRDEVESRVKHNSRERDRILPELAARGFEPTPTQANFVYVIPPDERDWFTLLLHEGVIVRPVPGGLRITFGTHEENDSLIGAIDHIQVS